MIGVKDLRVQYITNDVGERSAVILPIEDFRDLLEDLECLAIVAERRDEPTLSHEDLLAELQADGLL